LDARLKNLLCERIIVAKSKEGKSGYNLSEFPNEGYGKKRAVLPMMMMIMVMMIYNKYFCRMSNTNQSTYIQTSVKVA
jgi:hypothetical protein